MIIVEGPDGAGKTTLIKSLVQVTDLPVAPRVVSKEAEAMIDLKRWTEDNVMQGFQGVIYDRHRLISEPIYGSVLRNRFEPGFSDLYWLHQMNFQLYLQVKPILIYCLPPFPVVYDNVKDDPDNDRVASKIRKIYSLYVNKAATDRVMYDNTFIYDYTNDTYKGNMFAAIHQKIEEM